MKLKNVLLIVVFAALIALAILLPKASKGAPGAQGAQGAPAGAQAAGAPGGNLSGKKPATTFRITSGIATTRDLHSYLEVNGDVEADNTVDVYPDIAGKLVSLNFHLGSDVSKGDVIAQVDPSKPGAAYALSPVYAPISGTITSMPQKIGATVSTGTVISIIGDINNLQVTTKIPERDIASLRTGLAAEITFEAYPGAVFDASVFRVSPLVDSTSRTKEVFLSFTGDDARINAGMFAKIKLYTTVTKNAVSIPEESIVENLGKYYAYVVNADNTVTKREVTKGVSVDGITQILSGVTAGERVANEGVTMLSDGVTVKDISQASAETSSAPVGQDSSGSDSSGKVAAGDRTRTVGAAPSGGTK